MGVETESAQHPIGVEKKPLKRPGRPQVTVSKDAVERLKYHTLRDAADVLGVCPNTVRKLRQAHNVPTKQVARRTERHSITVDDIAQLIHLPISKAAEELHVSYATLKKRCKELGIEKWPSSHERWRNLPGAGQDAGLAIFPHQSDLQASGQALSYAQQHGYFRPAANCIPQFGLLGATGCSPGLRPLAGLTSLLQMSPSAQAGTSQMPSSGCPIDKFLESNPPNMEIRMTVEEFGKVAKSLGEFVKNSVEREFQKQREAEEKEKEKEKSTTEGGGECANLPTDVQSLLRECLSFKSIVKDVHDVLKTVETSHLRLLEHAQTLVSRGVQEETQGNP